MTPDLLDLQRGLDFAFDLDIPLTALVSREFPSEAFWSPGGACRVGSFWVWGLLFVEGWDGSGVFGPFDGLGLAANGALSSYA
jgi:hypothetical protein